MVGQPDGVEAGADAIAAYPVNCSVTAFLPGSILDRGVLGIVTHTPPSPAAILPPSPGDVHRDGGRHPARVRVDP